MEHAAAFERRRWTKNIMMVAISKAPPTTIPAIFPLIKPRSPRLPAPISRGMAQHAAQASPSPRAIFNFISNDPYRFPNLGMMLCGLK